MLYKFTNFTVYDDWGIFLNGEIGEHNKLSAYLATYYQSFLLLVGDSQVSENNLERVFMVRGLLSMRWGRMDIDRGKA